MNNSIKQSNICMTIIFSEMHKKYQILNGKTDENGYTQAGLSQ
jgi:hypothetical protein